MTAVYTSKDLGIRVELGDEDPFVLFSADYGTSWRVMSVFEARDLAQGLCLAAERAEDQDTERFHAA